MKAIGYQQAHTLEASFSLQDIELAQPVASGRDLLIKVNAISVNPVDTKVRQRASAEPGHYKVLGWDGVGEVVAVGEQVEFFQVGDRVWYAGDITRAGSNAEFQLVDERIVGHAPQSLSDEQAAAMPLTSLTAWELLFDRLGFDPQLNMSDSRDGRTRILVVGAAGGVGSMLVQLINKLTTAEVIATASRPESQAWLQSLGAHFIIDHHQSLAEQLAELGIGAVSHVISLTHTDQHFDALVELLAPQGKFALIDDPQQPIDIKKLKQKSLSLHWELMFTRAMFQTDDMILQQKALNRVAKWVDAGVLHTTLKQSFGVINAHNLIAAHRFLEQNQTIGKVVLSGF